MLVVPRDEPIILYSNVPERDEEYELFDSSKTYNLGDKVQFLDSIFESLKDNNTDEPIKNISSMSWFLKEKTNRYKIFDSSSSNATKMDEEIIYEFEVNDIDTICFFGLQAESIKIEIRKDEELVYEEEKVTYTRMVSNWWEWTVQKAIQKRVMFFRDLPSFYGARLKVFIKFAGGVSECSHLVFGKSLDFGITLADPAPTSSIRNLSSKEKQADGTIKTTISRIYKRITLTVAVDTNRVSEIQNFLEEYSLEAMLFIGVENDEFETLVVFGFYKDFDQPIGLEKSIYQIEIEGVI
ncbi:hypothetical protein AAX29_00556 [Aliarcobacter thereius]|uniref:Uncharacterized protein n=1 Tax=Aliarcobacter thereius TaxID=544718 RepID=A0A1C0B7D1_9BACT|nr:hypothetical protein [Aliarcobacter thereius]OCL99515.1 hypothetical protein AAX29_00556 [Aliarcobacter thereius]